VLALTSVAPSQTIYGVYEDANIVAYSPGGGSSTLTNGFGSVAGLAFDSAGNLYAATTDGIVKFTPGGAQSVFASTGLDNVTGIAFDPSGNLYAANNGNNTIEKFTPSGSGSVFASTGLNRPEGIAFDGAGNLYVANAGGKSIEKFTPGGAGSLFFNTATLGTEGGVVPSYLAVDTSGNVFMAAISVFNGGIWEITPGGVASVFGSGGTPSGGLAFDGADNLYVAGWASAANGWNSAIEEFASNGTESSFAHEVQVSFIAVQPTPEPATLSFLALGALAMFKRRKCQISSQG
jgi:hypothetical protein